MGELAFEAGSPQSEHAKTAVLAASLTAATLAALVLRHRERHYRDRHYRERPGTATGAATGSTP